MIEKVIFTAPSDIPAREISVTVKLDKEFIIEDPEELASELVDFIAWADHCQKDWGEFEVSCTFYNDTPRIGHKPKRC